MHQENFCRVHRWYKGYRLLDKSTNKIYYSRDVTFNEALKSINEETTGDSKIFVKLSPSTSMEKLDANQQDCQQENEVQETRKSSRINLGVPPERFGYQARLAIKEPLTWEEVLSSSNSVEWIEAANNEIEAMRTNNTWELVDLPKGRKAIPCKWVFRIKANELGEITRYKARLVAKGYAQSYGVDYEETFAPVVRINSIRTLLAVAMSEGLTLVQMDVTTAFLNGELEEELYMKQPEGFIDPSAPNKVLKLHKSIYGLKQAPRAWNKLISTTLTELGFRQGKAEPCLFTLKSKSIVHLALFVDDIIIAHNDNKIVDQIKSQLSASFKMKDMGELSFILGMKIFKESENTLKITQEKYIEEILDEFGMKDCKQVSTPQPLDSNIETDEEILNDEMGTLYRALIGKLMYAMTCTRPDIAKSVGVLSQALARPTKGHWQLAKRVLRYLRGTSKASLTIKGPSPNVTLNAFVDADWAGDKNDRKSTSGCIVQINGCPVSWFSKKQASVALSTTEAEYIAASACLQEVIWLRTLLEDLGFPQTEATRIYEDNQGCIKLAQNSRCDARTKHIDIRHHFIREKLDEKVIQLEYCPTNDNLADVFTKPLPGPQFAKLRDGLGLLC